MENMQSKCATILNQGFLKNMQNSRTFYILSSPFWIFWYWVLTNAIITFTLRVLKNEISFFSRLIFPRKICRDFYDRMVRIKFELIEKVPVTKGSYTNNNLKLKETASEWALKGFRENNYIYICELVKIALITPVIHAWLERIASAVKRVKSCMQFTMENDLLNSLLHILINVPSAYSWPVVRNMM